MFFLHHFSTFVELRDKENNIGFSVFFHYQLIFLSFLFEKMIIHGCIWMSLRIFLLQKFELTFSSDVSEIGFVISGFVNFPLGQIWPYLQFTVIKSLELSLLSKFRFHNCFHIPSMSKLFVKWLVVYST